MQKMDAHHKNGSMGCSLGKYTHPKAKTLPLILKRPINVSVITSTSIILWTQLGPTFPKTPLLCGVAPLRPWDRGGKGLDRYIGVSCL